MRPCPEAASLVDYASGALAADAFAFIEAHLEGCLRCAKSLAELPINDELVQEIRGLDEWRAWLAGHLERVQGAELDASTRTHGAAGG